MYNCSCWQKYYVKITLLLERTATKQKNADVLFSDNKFIPEISKGKKTLKIRSNDPKNLRSPNASL